MHKKQTASGAKLVAETAARNRGGGVREGGPGHPPKKVGFSKSRLAGRLTGREEANEEEHIMGYMEHRDSKGVSA